MSEINSHRFKFSLNNDLKKCPFCIVDCFEDEKHVLFVCPLYDQIRIKYLTYININSILNCNFRFNEFIKTNWFLISKLFHEIILLRRQTIKCRIWDVYITYYIILSYCLAIDFRLKILKNLLIYYIIQKKYLLKGKLISFGIKYLAVVYVYIVTGGKPINNKLISISISLSIYY